MDVGKSFTFMFEDKDWIAKLAIGGVVALLSIFVIPAPLLLGYLLRVTKNVADGNPSPLPEWQDLGEMYVKGLTAIVGMLLWFAPVVLVACCMILLVSGISAVSGNRDSAAGLAGIVLICLYCVIILLTIVLTFFVYAPLTRFALNRQINTFWDFQGTWRFIQTNLGNYFIAFLLLLAANFIAGFGFILCFVGVFFTAFWANLVGAHLFGQVARANMPPADEMMMPPTPPMDEPPSMMQGPMEPAPTA